MSTNKNHCYNCGKELTEGNTTREHIPARNLFDGYSEEFKYNRITVPACRECNNQYSYCDEEFRNMIGMIADKKENDTVASAATRSILRKKNGFDRLRFDLYGNVRGVEFNQDVIEEFHKKNFKGLFYHQYGYPLPNSYELKVNIDEKDFSSFTLCLIEYLRDYFDWKCSGSHEIFSYCIQPFRSGLKSKREEDFELLESDNIIVGLMKYNGEHAAMVLAIRKQFLEEIRNTHELIP